MPGIEQILIPVSVAEPCGEDLSFSVEMDAIARARQHDDPGLAQGEWAVALREADWPFVASHCAQLLQSRSKDLKLAVWLTEAQARTQHFRGLADGFALLAGLCERYWERLHPQGEQGDYEQRIGNLAWLLAQTPGLVKAMPVAEQGGVSMMDFDRARQRASRAERAEPKAWGASAAGADDEGPTVAELDSQRRRNSEAFNARLLEDAEYCLSALRALEQAVDARLGADGPSFAAAREALQHAVDFIGLLAPAAEGAAESGDGVLQSGGAAGVVPGRSGGAAGGGPPATRAQALAQLRLIADFFRSTEPHSPVAYLADKAASWGDMPLHEWLHAVVKDPALTAQLDELLGAA
jgi:type VI secretion system protein ImpA